MNRIPMVCSSVYRLFFIPSPLLHTKRELEFPWLSLSGQVTKTAPRSAQSEIKNRKPGTKPGFAVLVLRRRRVCLDGQSLLRRGHFFGFAFLAHQLELALGFLVGLGHFLLDALGRFFELR